MGKQHRNLLRCEPTPFGEPEPLPKPAADELHRFVERCQVAALLIPGANTAKVQSLIGAVHFTLPRGEGLAFDAAQGLFVWLLARALFSREMEPPQFRFYSIVLRRHCSAEGARTSLHDEDEAVERAKPDSVGPIDLRVTAAMRIAECSYSSHGLSESRVAAQVRLSISHFGRLFRAHAGMSFGEYLKVVRVRAALPLLSDRNLPIARVAQQVGYSYTETFDRDFQYLLGMPPRVFRACILCTASAHVASWTKRRARFSPGR